MKSYKPIILALTFAIALLAVGGCEIAPLPWCATGGAPATGQQADLLRSLGYVATAKIAPEDMELGNVTAHEGRQAFAGINLYCTSTGDSAVFMDMDGKVIHAIKGAGDSGCNLLEPHGEGQFVELRPGYSIEGLDWDSNRVWYREGKFHHDLDISDDGRIYALYEAAVNYSAINPAGVIVDNYILELSANGTTLRNWSFADMVVQDPYLLAMVKNRSGDIFHMNTLELIGSDVDGLWAKGDVLVSARDIDTIAVVDLDRGKIVWHWGDKVLEHQHQPTILENGNMLVFDNGVRRNFSKVVEVNVSTGDIVWEYSGNPPSRFFSDMMGGAQRLPNGNTLITESLKGHAFEVTRDGKVVWDFWEPNKKDGERRTIYRMTRLPAGFHGLSAGQQRTGVTVKPDKTSLCDSIRDEKSADSCFKDVGEEMDNLTLCDRAQDLSIGGMCQGDISIARKDRSICSRIQDADAADRCFEFHAVYGNDSGMCAKLRSAKDGERCVWRVAEKAGDVGLCETITGQDLKGRCIMAIAQRKADPKLCISVESVAARDRCLANSAVAAKDASSCGGISEEWRRQDCARRAQTTDG